ncbi:MAG: TA system VapC family ribonuclease toxin [Solirubrobacterales bacterium]
MALLDVNALVALGWDSHVHHQAVREWFLDRSGSGWQTCPASEAGFVRVSSNPKVLPHQLDVASAIQFLAELRKVGVHRFLADDVSVTDPDFPAVHGYRQVSDAHLLTVARRNEVPLLTFDRALAERSRPDEVILLTT